jgi:shikimate kinase
MFMDALPTPSSSPDSSSSVLAPGYIGEVARHPALSRLILTGFMGCGKSTLGRKLADKLRYTFVDLDSMIEKQQHKKIVDIFQQDGEAAFREYERQALQQCMTLERHVIATGGGALVRQDNLDLALDGGIVVYIEIQPEDLLERILFSPKDRPLMDVPDPEAVFTRLFEQRKPFYEQAQVHVDTARLKPDEAVQAILTSLDKYVRYFLPVLPERTE